MKLYKLASTSLLLFSLLLAGCSNSNTSPKEENIKNKETLTVLTTIFPLEDFTKKIGGNYVDVKSIYPPNVDAHDFEPSTKDMISLADSDLFIYTGAGIDGFATKAVESLKGENVKIVEAAKGIDLIKSSHEEGEESEDHDHGDVDPHLWLDPVLSIDLATNIKNSLSEKMPEHAKDFEKNYLKLRSDLEKLDKDFQTTISSSKTKYLLVAHAAYGYWEHRYGIKQISITGLSPTQEPTQKGLQNIVEQSTKHHIHYVIFEQSASPKVAQIIQDELGAESLTLHNLESVTDENIKNHDDYFSIMRRNLETIKTALND